jgi:excisionase family DNA binding protein
MPTPRFLTLDDVAEILNVSWSQAYALVRRRELIAIQIGGRGAWRVENTELDRFIERKYAEARAGAISPEDPDDEEGTAGDSAGDRAHGRVEPSDPAGEPPAGKTKQTRRRRS